ncbi:MAG: addiction module protein [Hyphomicrobiaceae bacterium]
MNEPVKKLTDEAAALTPDEQAELVEGILQTLDVPDRAIEAAWAAEIKDRLAACRRGELETVDFDEVLAGYEMGNLRS